MKIAVAVPHTGTLKAETAQCLGALLMATSTARIIYNGTATRPEIDLLFGGAGPLDWKRTNLALAALKQGADYLLWIDSDQTFARDALMRLMAHDKAIVGANYASRHDGTPTALDRDGNKIRRRSGIEEVGAVGLGLCLMQAPILRRVPKPWFATEIGPDGECVVGEDVHFCNQARQAGIPVFVDHDLEVGHIAERVLKLEREDAGAAVAPPKVKVE